METLAANPSEIRTQTDSKGRLTRERARFSSINGNQADLKAQVREKSGELRDVSLITAGEAKGHGIFIDERSLETAMDFLLGKSSLKSYITHGQFWEFDRLTQEAGLFSGFFLDGDQIKARQFSAFNSFREHHPDRFDGLFELAAKMPEDFGVSISFSGNLAWPLADEDGNPTGEDAAFDPYGDKPENTVREIPSVRFSEIYSGDFVDEPAANEAGLFKANSPRENQQLTMDNQLTLTIEGETATFDLGDLDAIAEKLGLVTSEQHQAAVEVARAAEAESATEGTYDAAAVAELIEGALKEDRDRALEILNLCELHKAPELAAAAIRDGTETKDFTATLLEAKRSPALKRPDALFTEKDGDGDATLPGAPANAEEFAENLKTIDDPKQRQIYFRRHKQIAREA